jgi:quercetin dioxygenase-like cupin family protein
MLYKKDPTGYKEPKDGIQYKVLVHGEKTMLIEFIAKGGTVYDVDSHPQEQTGYLFSGKMKITMGSKVYEVESGDSYVIAGGIEHGTEYIEDCIGIEVFSPIREDML